MCLLHRRQPSPLPKASSHGVSLSSVFANYFKDKVSTLRVQITSASDETSSPHVPCPPYAPATLLQFRTVSQDEVAKALLSPSGKCCDLDPLPTSLLKQCLSVLLPTITNIGNLSVSSGTFTDQLNILSSSLCWRNPILTASRYPFIVQYPTYRSSPYSLNDWLRHNSQNTWIQTLFSTRASLLIWSTIPQKLFCFQSMTTVFKPSATSPSHVFDCLIFLQLSILLIILLSWNVFRIGLNSVILFLPGLHLIFIPVPFQARQMAAFPELFLFHMVSPRDPYWDHWVSCCTLLLSAILCKLVRCNKPSLIYRRHSAIYFTKTWRHHWSWF